MVETWLDFQEVRTQCSWFFQVVVAVGTMMWESPNFGGVPKSS